MKKYHAFILLPLFLLVTTMAHANVTLTCESDNCMDLDITRNTNAWPRDFYVKALEGEGPGQWQLFEGWKMKAEWAGDNEFGVSPDIVLKVTPAGGAPEEACYIQAFNQSANVCTKQSIFAVDFDGRTIVPNPQMPVWYIEGDFSPGDARSQACYGGGERPSWFDVNNREPIKCDVTVQAIAYTAAGELGRSSEVTLSASIVPKPLAIPKGSRPVTLNLIYNFDDSQQVCKEDPGRKLQCESDTIRSYTDFYKDFVCDKVTPEGHPTGESTALAADMISKEFPVTYPGGTGCKFKKDLGRIVDTFTVYVPKDGEGKVYLRNPKGSKPFIGDEGISNKFYLANYVYEGQPSPVGLSADYKITIPAGKESVDVQVEYKTVMEPAAVDIDYGSLSGGISTKQRFQYGTYQAYLQPSKVGSLITAFYTYFAFGGFPNPGIDNEKNINFGYTWHEIDYEFTPPKHPQINPPAYLDDGTFDTYLSKKGLGKAVSLNIISEGNADLKKPGAPQHHFFCPNIDNEECFADDPDVAASLPDSFPYDGQYRLYTLVWDREKLDFYFEIYGQKHLALSIPLKKKDELSAAVEGVLATHFFAQDRFNEAMVIDGDGKYQLTSPQFILVNLWQFTPAGKFTGVFTDKFNSAPYYNYTKMVRWSPCVDTKGQFVTKENCSGQGGKLLGKVYAADGMLLTKQDQHEYQWCFGSETGYGPCTSNIATKHNKQYNDTRTFLEDDQGWMYIPQVGWAQNTSRMVQNAVSVDSKNGLEVCLTAQWPYRAHWSDDKKQYTAAIGCDGSPLLPVPSDANNIYTALVAINYEIKTNEFTKKYAEYLDNDLIRPDLLPSSSLPDDFGYGTPDVPGVFNNTWQGKFSKEDGDGCAQMTAEGKRDPASRKPGFLCATDGIYGDPRVKPRAVDAKGNKTYGADIFWRLPTRYVPCTQRDPGNKECLARSADGYKRVVLKNGFAPQVLPKLAFETGPGKSVEIGCTIEYKDLGSIPKIEEGEPLTLQDGGSYVLKGVVTCAKTN